MWWRTTSLHVVPGGHPISLCAGSVLDAAPLRIVDIARGCGYDLLGLRLDPVELDPPAVRAIRAGLDDTGMSLLDVEVVRLGSDDIDTHLPLLDLAAELDAQHVLAVGECDDPDRLSTAVHRLAAAAVERDLTVSLEFMGFTSIQTLAHAATLATGIEGVVLVVDALHLIRTGSSAAELADLPAGLLGYAQLCDAPIAAPTDRSPADEARHARSAPGDGELPLRAFVDALPPGCPIGVEVQNDDLRDRYPPAERAAVVLERTRRLLHEAGRGADERDTDAADHDRSDPTDWSLR